MLILTRRKGETIRIGDDIFVTLNNIKGNQVSLGTDAPKDKNIRRVDGIIIEKIEPILNEEKKVKVIVKKSRLNKDKS